MLSSDEYRAVFEAAPDGYLVVDSGGRIRDLNPKVESMFGWAREELLGEGIEMLVPMERRGAHSEHLRAFVESPRSRPMGAGLELSALRQDGSTFPVEISLSPWTSHGLQGVICTVRDVTDRLRMRRFTEGALKASEEERQRIARELHDDTAQRLATLVLRVRGLAAVEDSGARAALFEEIRSEIIDTSDGVRRIARGLRPPELEEVGLDAALRAHCRNMYEGTHFEVELSFETFDIETGLDITAQLVLYRVVQEALTNAMRHSGAAQAKVRLAATDGGVIAEISDTGQGFVASKVTQLGAGLGIVGMQERASMVGGSLSFESGPAIGTVVRLEIPVRALEKQDA